MMNNTSLAKRDIFDWLDDLCVRFIINLPLEELAEAERTCFQIEEAQWFYEDFIRPLDPDNLPVLNLRNFYMLICQHCPILCDYPAEQHAEAFEKFLQYKTRVPVRGAIMLNEAMDEVVLVKGWKKNANWSFPRGKINKEESDLTCAVREVYEETGYDLEAAGLVRDEERTKSIELTMREQSLKLFVFRGVPMDTYFEPRTRKEISKIQWYKLSELPTIKKKGQQQEEKGEALASNANKFYMVAPFLGHLKKWIAQQRKLDKTNPGHRAIIQHQVEIPAATDVDESHAEEGTGTRGDIDKLLDAHRLRKRKGAAARSKEEISIATDVEVHQEEPVSGPSAKVDELLEVHWRKETLDAQTKSQQTPSDLPEVSSSFIRPELVSSKMHIEIPPNADQQKKIDLLAILKGTKTLNVEPPPQTPAAQMIDEPVMPHSPPHHHLSRMPTLPLVPTLADDPVDLRNAETKPKFTQRATASIPTAGSGRSIPQARLLEYSDPPSLVNKRLPITGPHQQRGPKFAAASPQFTGQGPSIPPASDLPKPILNQQKASLLSLFKQSTALPNPPIEATPKILNSTPTSSLAFVPPQVLSRSSTAKASPGLPMSGQKADLLAMFKTPSTPKPPETQGKESTSSLHAPLQPIELSAFPSPGHSRVQSQTKSEPQKIHTHGYVNEKKSGPQSGPLQSPPTSATISGPLNIPQFDMIAKHHREAKHIKPRKEINSQTISPVTILPRPGNQTSKAAGTPSPPRPPPSMSGVKTSPQPMGSLPRKEKPAHPKQLLTPVKTTQPPAPTLEAQSTPSKQFQPQILKRPTHLQNEIDNMSPIQPLPSPKHALPVHKAPQKLSAASTEHKKSLLSLFSAPSPIVSPPSAPVETGNSLASLVSPLSEYRGPQPGVERQKSWKENQIFAPVGYPQDSSAAADINEGYIQQSSSPHVADTGREQVANETGHTMAPSRESRPEPKRTRSSKATPSELKNLLLGRLANIKV